MGKKFNFFVNGKIYYEEPDFKALFAEQENRIIQYLEEQYENKDNITCYHNEYFKRAIDAIFKQHKYSLLNGIKVSYTPTIEIALMKFGSYDYIDQNFKYKNEVFASLDNMAMDMQVALIDTSKEAINNSIGLPKLPDNMGNIIETFDNYTDNYFPQRLAFYTSDEKYDDFILQMKELYDLLMKIFDDRILGIRDHLLNAQSIYSLNEICQLIDIRKGIKTNNYTNEEMIELIERIDNLTSNGVLRFGLLNSVLNFANIYCNKTLNSAVDQIACRLLTADDREVSDVVDFVYNFFMAINNNIRIDYAQNYLSVNKLLQIEYINTLPPVEQAKVKQILDKLLNREEIELPDLEPIYNKIIKGQEVTDEEYKLFYDGSFEYLKKNGIMPENYAEVLFACILDKDSYLGKSLNVAQIEIIIENLFRTKAERMLGNKSYISFDYRLPINDAGTHIDHYMQIKHVDYGSEFVCKIMDLLTAIHEIRHEKQTINKGNNKYDALTYLFVKEEVLRHEAQQFYKDNYSNIYFELDAESFALTTIIHFLETVKPRGFTKDPDYEPYMNYLKNRKKEFLDRFKTANTKIIKGKDPKQDRIIKLQDLFDSLMEKVPSLIEEYPILETEYNRDGTRKTIFQMFQDLITKFREGGNRRDTFSLYKYVLQTRVSNDIKEFEQLSDIVIPTDLPDSSRRALNVIKDAVLDRSMELLIGSTDEVELDLDY